MAKSPLSAMSRRERQIMDIIYSQGQATAAEIHQRLPDPPSYSTVRTLLRVLEEKEYLTHKSDGPRYVYSPRISPEKAKRSALDQLLRTFFDNSAAKAMVALMDMSSSDLSDTELNQLAERIRQAREREQSNE